MDQPFTLEQKSFPLAFRLPMLVAGLGFLVFGLFGLVKVVEAVLIGPIPDTFVIGTLASLAATGMGGLLIWAFTIPDKLVIFDPTQKRASVRFTYPLGLTRNRIFDLSELSPPEVFFHKDPEFRDGGYWELKVTLPDGRIISRAPDKPQVSDQKSQAEAWRKAILSMME